MTPAGQKVFKFHMVSLQKKKKYIKKPLKNDNTQEAPHPTSEHFRYFCPARRFQHLSCHQGYESNLRTDISQLQPVRHTTCKRSLTAR